MSQTSRARGLRRLRPEGLTPSCDEYRTATCNPARASCVNRRGGCTVAKKTYLALGSSLRGEHRAVVTFFADTHTGRASRQTTRSSFRSRKASNRRERPKSKSGPRLLEFATPTKGIHSPAWRRRREGLRNPKTSCACSISATRTVSPRQASSSKSSNDGFRHSRRDRRRLEDRISQ